MIRITEPIVATVAAGTTTASKTSGPVYAGRMLGVYMSYSGTLTTADVTVATAGTPPITFVTVTNLTTAGWYYPRAQVCTTAGTLMTYDGTHPMADTIPFASKLRVSVAEAGPGDIITVYAAIQE